MRRADDREQRARPAGRDAQNDQPETHLPETHLDETQVATGGGLHYHKARRQPGGSDVSPHRTEPDDQQQAGDHGGPSPDDESWLQDQGYPKLGRKMQSRLTQVEHGPYAGGTQQGGAAARDRASTRPDGDSRR